MPTAKVEAGSLPTHADAAPVAADVALLFAAAEQAGKVQGFSRFRPNSGHAACNAQVEYRCDLGPSFTSAILRAAVRPGWETWANAA